MSNNFNVGFTGNAGRNLELYRQTVEETADEATYEIIEKSQKQLLQTARANFSSSFNSSRPLKKWKRHAIRDIRKTRIWTNTEEMLTKGMVRIDNRKEGSNDGSFRLAMLDHNSGNNRYRKVKSSKGLGFKYASTGKMKGTNFFSNASSSNESFFMQTSEQVFLRKMKGI